MTSKEDKSHDPGWRLRHAASQGDLELGAQLLTAGVDPESPSSKHGTPLFFAAQDGHADFIRMLLDAGAQVEAALQPHRVTPLLTAAFGGHMQAVQLLLAAGASPNARRATDDATPLLFAVSSGNLALAELLLAAGADKNAVRSDGASSLFIASQDGHFPLVELLLTVGADKRIRRNGILPYDQARARQHVAVYELFDACRPLPPDADAVKVRLLTARKQLKQMKQIELVRRRCTHPFAKSSDLSPSNSNQPDAQDQDHDASNITTTPTTTTTKSDADLKISGAVDLSNLNLTDGIFPHLSFGDALRRAAITAIDLRNNPGISHFPRSLAPLFPSHQLQFLRFDARALRSPLERALAKADSAQAILEYLQLLHSDECAGVLALRGVKFSPKSCNKLLPFDQLQWTHRLRILDLRDNPSLVEIPECLAYLPVATFKQLLMDPAPINDPLARLIVSGRNTVSIIQFARLLFDKPDFSGVLDFSGCQLVSSSSSFSSSYSSNSTNNNMTSFASSSPLDTLEFRPWLKRIRTLDFRQNPDLHQLPRVLRCFHPADVDEILCDPLHLSSSVEKALARCGDPCAIIEYCREKSTVDQRAQVETAFIELCFAPKSGGSGARKSALSHTPPELEKQLLMACWRAVEAPHVAFALKKSALSHILHVIAQDGAAFQWWLFQAEQSQLLFTLFSLPSKLMQRAQPLLVAVFRLDQGMLVASRLPRLSVFHTLFLMDPISRNRAKAEQFVLDILESKFEEPDFLVVVLKHLIAYPRWSFLGDADLAFLERLRAAFDFHRVTGPQLKPLLEQLEQKVRFLAHHLIRQHKDAPHQSPLSASSSPVAPPPDLSVLDAEYQILSDPDRLLEEGLVLESSLDGVGKVLFSLADLPVGQYFKTPSGHHLTRTDPTRCTLWTFSSGSQKIERIIQLPRIIKVVT